MKLSDMCKYVRSEVTKKPWYLMKFVYVTEHYIILRRELQSIINQNYKTMALNPECLDKDWYKMTRRETDTLCRLIDLLPAYGED